MHRLAVLACLPLLLACQTTGTTSSSASQPSTIQVQWSTTPYGQCVASIAPLAEPERSDCRRGVAVKLGGIRLDTKAICRAQERAAQANYQAKRTAYNQQTRAYQNQRCLDAADTRRLQQNLSTLGLYRGGPDGQVGRGTLAALQAFHRKYGVGQGATLNLTTGYAQLVRNQASTRIAALNRAEREKFEREVRRCQQSGRCTAKARAEVKRRNAPPPVYSPTRPTRGTNQDCARNPVLCSLSGNW